MSGHVVFVYTSEGREAGPWEGSHHAMAHCAAHRGHAHTGNAVGELDEGPIPASTTEERDTRNRQHEGDPNGALGAEDSTRANGQPAGRRA